MEVDAQGNLVWDAGLVTTGIRGNFVGYRAARFPIYFPDDTEFDIYYRGPERDPPGHTSVNSSEIHTNNKNIRFLWGISSTFRLFLDAHVSSS